MLCNQSITCLGCTDACLKIAKIRLQLMIDHIEYPLVENAIQAVVSICQRCNKSNTPHICDDYESSKPNLVCYDVNNLYGNVAL